MSKLLRKEMRLSASVLTYLFILFGFMFMLPGYPVLCGAFFVTLGIYQSFQNIRETNDIVFSVLLPVAKKDVVKSKYAFVCFIEICAIVLMSACVLLRMTALSGVPAYRNNALMNANLFALGMSFVIFGMFNAIFIGGFFRTAYKIGTPFLIYIIVTFLLIGVAEAAHYFPGMEAVNSFGFENIGLQLILLIGGIVIYVLLTWISYKKACIHFEKINL